MGYLLLSITLASSAVAFRAWTQIITPWILRRQGAQDVADAAATDWPGIISDLLPRRIRRFWNFSVVAACVFFLGFPHHVVLWRFFDPAQLDPWLYFHYAWSLAYWLALLALPALILARHRLAVEQRKAASLQES